MHYKYCKAQSKFLDVMRELNRFRNDFNDCYSVRAKLLETQEESLDISEVLTHHSKLLEKEKSVLNGFREERRIMEEDKVEK